MRSENILGRFSVSRLLWVSLAALLCASGSAQAAPSAAGLQVEFERVVLRVAVDPSDQLGHRIVISHSASAYVIADAAGVGPSPCDPASCPASCTPISANRLRCPDKGGEVDSIAVQAGSGSDLIDLTATLDYAFADGGAGDDRILGGSHYGLLRGSEGGDILRLGTHPPSPSGKGHFLNSGFGGPGSDRVLGGARGDGLRGGSGKDSILGGRGPDHLTGGKDRDLMDGGRGNDTLHARDGAPDEISCGPGDRWRQRAVRDSRERRIRVRGGYKPINCYSISGL